MRDAGDIEMNEIVSRAGCWNWYVTDERNGVSRELFVCCWLMEFGFDGCGACHLSLWNSVLI
jgi:hypothetical protein